MEKRNIIALVAVIALGAGAFFALRQPEKGVRTGPAPRPIAAFKAADVAQLELTNDKQEKTVLTLRPNPAKVGGEWRVTSPVDQPADGAGVKAVVDGLEKLAFGDMVTEQPTRFEDLGVADAKAQHVTAKSGTGAVLADFLMGKSVGGFTMIRPAGKNEVWQATGFFPYMTNREPKAWRYYLIFELAANDIDVVGVEAGASKVTFTREAAKPAAEPPAADKKAPPKPKPSDTWTVTASTGTAPKASDKLDTGLVAGLAQQMSTLRATDFADDKKPEAVGLDKPRVTVSATAKGQTYTLLIGNSQGDDVYVRRGDAPQIYTIKKYAIERLQHAPIDYRDKTLVAVKETDLTAIDVVFGAESFTLERTPGKADWHGKGKDFPAKADDAKLKPLTTAFESFGGAAFADEAERDVKVNGLGKPTGSVTLHTKDKATTTLKIGALKDNSDYFVQKVGAPDVLLVKRFVVDRFLKKPADFAAGAPAVKPAAAKDVGKPKAGKAKG